MDTATLAKLIGRTGLLTLGKLRVEITVMDARTMYGRTDLLCRPVAGSGEEWKSLDAVKLAKG